MKFVLNPFTRKLDAVGDGIAPGDVLTIKGDIGPAVGGDGTGNINILGAVNGLEVTGNSSTNTLEIKDLRNAYKYVVDAVLGEAEYTTIQSAIDAANIAGGATVFVRDGTYVEDLVLYDNTNLIGESLLAIIEGQHTLPSSGTLVIDNFTLNNSDDIFVSTAAGTTEFSLLNANINVSVIGKYIVNAPNWTSASSIYVKEVEEIIGTSISAFINVRGGATVFVDSSQVGALSTATISDSTLLISNSIVRCDMDILGASTYQLDNSLMLGTITMGGTSEVEVTNSEIKSSGSVAITNNSSGTAYIYNSKINSFISGDVIEGTGPVELNGVTFKNESDIQSTVPLSNDGLFRSSSHEILTTNAADTAHTLWSYFGVQNYSLGIDTADSNRFKITDGATPNTGDILWQMEPTGEVTIPKQPAFAAYRTTSIGSVTGSGTVIDPVPFNSEVLGRNSGYNPTTFIFTAPVKGVYHFDVGISFGGIVAANDFINCRLVTTTRECWLPQTNIGVNAMLNCVSSHAGSWLVEMDVGDTAKVTAEVSGNTTDNIDLRGGATGSFITYFSGALIC